MVMDNTAFKLYGAEDLELYTDAGTTLTGQWDGLTGDINLADGAVIGNIGGAGPEITFDDTNNYLEIMGCNVGINDAAPGHSLDVGGDINVHAGSGFMINDTAPNRHVLIGDGTRGIFRALVADDLPAASNIWTRAGTTIYQTNSGDDVVLYGAGDFKVYDGTPGNLKASIDGATGMIQAGRRVSFVDANTYVDRNPSGWVTLYTDLGGWFFHINSAIRYAFETNSFRPYHNNLRTCGTSGTRWSNVYSVLGNFSGTLTTAALVPQSSAAYDIGTSSVRYRDLFLSRNADIDGSLDVLNNIAVGGTVDGVDISAFKAAYDAHTHTISGNTADTTPTIGGRTGTWTTYGTPWYGGVFRIGGSTNYQIYAKVDGGAAGWYSDLEIKQYKHYHVASGDGYALTCSAHHHAAGTLATAVP